MVAICIKYCYVLLINLYYIPDPPFLLHAILETALTHLRIRPCDMWSWHCHPFTIISPTCNAGLLRLFHVGLLHTVAPLCNSLRNDVASMETYSSWMNCPKEKCVSADLMHLFLVRFVTVRLTYIFIDYPDCEYIIILNTSIVIYDFWRLSVLRSSTPSMPIFGNRHRQKACLLTNTRMIHTHLFTINMILM